jgi:hypothetical protein
MKMPGRGLEPLRISPPDPKSGASANSATLAYLIINDLQISICTKNAFVLEFVLELGSERLCNAKKFHIARVDAAALVSCLQIIAPSLFPHAIPAIAESRGFISEAIVITRSFGLMAETAKKRPASFRFETVTMSPFTLYPAQKKRSKSNDTNVAKISCRQSGISRSFAIIAPPILKKQECNESAPTQLLASARRSPGGAIISVTFALTRSPHL